MLCPSSKRQIISVNFLFVVVFFSLVFTGGTVNSLETGVRTDSGVRVRINYRRVAVHVISGGEFNVSHQD